MKIDATQPPATDLAIHAEARHEYKHIGKIRMKKGMRLYGYNIETDELEEVVVTKQVNVTTDGKPQTEMRANHQQNVVYIQSLNQKNARKKAEKLKKRFNLKPIKPQKGLNLPQ